MSLLLFCSAAGLLGAAVGCQALVSGDPTFRCTSDDGCPSGTVCATTAGTCVKACNVAECDARGGTCDPATKLCVVNAVVDATLPEDAGRDVTEADAPRAGILGARCDFDRECDSKLCIDARHLAAPVFAVTRSVCSQPCCNSAGCPTGFFCHAGGKGGRYCISQTTMGRPTTGTKMGGDLCASNGECRSGQCATTPAPARCVDTCCGEPTSGCVVPSICTYGSVDGVKAWGCATVPISLRNLDTLCSADAECKSNFCEVRCRGTCSRNLGTNGCIGGSVCSYAYGALYAEQPLYCSTFNTTAPDDAVCSQDTDCRSSFCDGTRCATVCSTDADCPTAKPRCRPHPTQPTPRLRCTVAP